MNTPVEQLVDHYLTSLRSNGASLKTVNDGYGYPLRKVFLPWLADHKITEPTQITTQVLEGLSASLRTRGGVRKAALSENTVHTYLRNIGFLLNWARAEGIDVPGSLGPVRNQSGTIIRKSRLTLPEPPPMVILERSEIDCLEAMAKKSRDKLIVRTLADSGIRVGELCALKVSDVDPAGYLHVVGSKDNRARAVPIRDDLLKRLTDYIAKDRKKTSAPYVFLGYAMVGGEYQPLTPSGVQQLTRGLGEQCKEKGRLAAHKDTNPHIFRHSYATHCLVGGMDPVTLSRILGHKSLRMIQEVYAHLKPVDTRAALLKVL
jgi:integrase